jgi:hypothetical protein
VTGCFKIYEHKVFGRWEHSELTSSYSRNSMYVDPSNYTVNENKEIVLLSSATHDILS